MRERVLSFIGSLLKCPNNQNWVTLKPEASFGYSMWAPGLKHLSLLPPWGMFAGSCTEDRESRAEPSPLLWDSVVWAGA